MEKNSNLLDRQIDISFCLPVYNVKNFLEDCLQSIRGQNLEKYGLSYEIFCIDDGSKDGSYELLLEKSLQISQLRVDKNLENKGVSYTRNRLIREANGKYIWFIDPDDMLIPNAVVPFYNNAEKYHVDVLLGNYICIDEETKGNSAYSFEVKTAEREPENKETYLPVDQDGIEMCSVCGGLFLREFLLENHLVMHEEMIAFEDTLFYYDFSMKTKNVWKWETPCYLYRKRANSVMNNTKDDKRNKKYFISIYHLWEAYEKYKKMGNPANDSMLDYKVMRMEGNMALCLAIIDDKQFVKEWISNLEKQGVDIYKMGKSRLRQEGPSIIRILSFILGKKLIFWLYRFILRK